LMQGRRVFEDKFIKKSSKEIIAVDSLSKLQ
jgi:hypothetical protein